MEQYLRLSPDDGTPLVDPGLYRHLIGHLIYLTISQPDIAFAVNQLSRFITTPTNAHLQAVYCVLSYIKDSLRHGLFFLATNDLCLTAYIDCDWANCPTTRYLTIGFFITLRSSPIFWRSKKQDIVFRSSSKAKYRIMATTTCKLVWLTTLLCDFSFHTTDSIHFYCDNQYA